MSYVREKTYTFPKTLANSGCFGQRRLVPLKVRHQLTNNFEIQATAFNLLFWEQSKIIEAAKKDNKKIQFNLKIA